MKTAIINLYGDETGTLCEAFEPIDGDLQPEELDGTSISYEWMPPADTMDRDSEAEKQCVRAVLRELTRMGYNNAVFWEGSELQPRWIKTMLQEFSMETYRNRYFTDLDGHKHKQFRVRSMGKNNGFGVLNVLTNVFAHTGSFTTREKAYEWMRQNG